MVSILRFSLIIGLAESQVLYPRHGQQVSPDETLSRKVGEMLREHVMPILKTYFEDMQKDHTVFPPLKYSPPCQDCSCIPENTLSCNSSSGQCICKAGYEGDNCSCRKGNHACNLQFATCQIWFNREMCICKPQYANLGISGCQDVVRLRDGNSTYNGRVEVYRNEEWMTVCDDAWTKHDAMVTCRMLGLPMIYPQAVPGGVFPSGHVSQSIGMDDVYCDGDESFLTDCKHSATENCNHSEDAGVICDPGKHGVTTFYSFERDDNTSFTQMTNDDFDWTRRSIWIEAVRGDGIKSDIAIDELYTVQDRCCLYDVYLEYLPPWCKPRRAPYNVDMNCDSGYALVL
ncbi:hypothetical protein FSP39_025416 [Pinctada imbricata]|uniref:SRCR domain-containing protein n=1 Tax=Pinctada imbricata TaxID=66713 RepID=A0AA88YSF4_PINIB|nr:hypothetical protein FSP39_025416 [Pinctada imbricata]